MGASVNSVRGSSVINDPEAQRLQGYSHHGEIVGIAGADPNDGGLDVTTSQLGPISGNCPPIQYDRLRRNELQGRTGV